MSGEKPQWGLKVRVWVERKSQKVLGPGRVELLEHIDRERSISAAARKMKMSYRRAWELVQAMNLAAGIALVEASPGGSGGGGASVTPEGYQAIRLYRTIEAQIIKSTEQLELPEEPLSTQSGKR